MDLACGETSNKCIRAVKDRAIFKDDRVINNLLNDEVFYVPSCDYFTKVQNDIQPFMRKVVTTWMLEVCEEQMCEDQILPLAVNLMDRFLCVCKIKRQHLQLLGATCLLIASKLRSTNFLTIDLLCAYTDYSVTYDLVVVNVLLEQFNSILVIRWLRNSLRSSRSHLFINMLFNYDINLIHTNNWEQLVLSKLQYNLSAVTGYDYIDQVIERCSWSQNQQLLRRHAHTLVSICSTEPSLIQTPPSVVAAACLSSAVQGLKLPCQRAAMNEICKMLNVDVDQIDLLINIVDNVVEKVANPEAANQKAKEPTKKPAGYESPGYGQPETPTEVENVYF